jgi:hypothetical protein
MTVRLYDERFKTINYNGKVCSAIARVVNYNCKCDAAIEQCILDINAGRQQS